MSNIALESLIGLHLLQGVDTDISCNDPDKHVGWIRFVLDGVTYEAVEDPEDEYRNSMDHIANVRTKVNNTFRGVKVLARMRDETSSEILQLVSLKTGKVILEVGTDNLDDYYPSWVATFNPENL